MPLTRRTLLGTGVALAATRVEAVAAGRDGGAGPAAPAWCGDRMPPIPPERQTELQKQASAEFLAGRATPVFGPFVPLLRSPEVMLRAKAMGDYLRYKSSLPPKLNELAILLTARHWSQSYEWAVHQPLALKAGVSAEVASAVAEGRRPGALDEAEQAVHDFVTELLNHQAVSDATYQAAVRRFGEQGTIDLISVCGYYAFLALVLNVARTPAPQGAPSLPAFVCA
ncbi:MAG TPA: carboxymuconolactone decarboxylase family protein [Myxococcaceae bacterium]|nr:carboxymuconolactone decarboxylase family protein [Myxococcaceae bacterium]